MRRNVIIIGSGAAGYAAAYRLLSFGVEDVALVTEGVNFGTSRNTGSDKQTYYKTDLSVSNHGILDMAKAIFNSGGIDGDKAIIEAVNSARCFYTLVDLGVNFPEGELGEFIGYQTDHDDSERATSIGPYTSKAMTEALEKANHKLGLEVLDKLVVIKILVENNIAKGVLVFDRQTNEIKAISANYVILAVGGSSCVYKQSVYPGSQHGAMSLALDAGCMLDNIVHWQYGIASTKFRWNLSGSYQQVIPRYISRDENGEEREFLLDYIDKEDVYKFEFLKGYEWPFDTRKVLGSSKVDLAVLEEIKKGRDVYLDFSKDPIGLDIESIPVAYEYLKKADALGSSPIERLRKLNQKAINLYHDHHIDIEKEYLKIGVCAQHCNGGVRIDTNYQTDVKNLFAIGEVSGNFGVYRPGGTALNSTQVGALRCAQYIKRQPVKEVEEKDYKSLIKSTTDFVKMHIGPEDNLAKAVEVVGSLMSDYAGIKRDIDKVDEIIKGIQNLRLYIKDISRGDALFKVLDMLKTDIALLNAIKSSKEIGSVGGAMLVEKGEMIKPMENIKDFVVESDYYKASLRKVKELKVKEYSFEQEMKKI